MTARTPILDRAADRLVSALWWLDQRLPGRCAHCRAWVQWRHHEVHALIDHADEVLWRDR